MVDSRKTTADVAATLILAHEILYEIGMPPTGDVADRIADRIGETVSRLVGQERERCVEICKRRAVLWSNTPMASSPLGREESRARANEATYIADAIGSR
jgi:hypothetical protein